MQPTKYIWKNGEWLPWAEATTHVLTHGLHYGSAAFEGIRCYKTPRGSAVFRLDRHISRLLYSAQALGMKLPHERNELMRVCTEVVSRNGLEECYIRPIVYYGYGRMGLNPTGLPVDIAVACWAWGKYLAGDMVKIKISDYIRIHPKSSVTDAKLAGHYVNSIMASLEVRGDDRYDEALFLDYEGNIAEGPGENFFLVKDRIIHTPAVGRILPGIKRDTVMTLAREEGYEVIERTIAPAELNDCDEAFFTGTACEVTGISSIGGRQIGTGAMGPVTRQLKEVFLKAVHGELGRHEEWLFSV